MIAFNKSQADLESNAVTYIQVADSVRVTHIIQKVANSLRTSNHFFVDSRWEGHEVEQHDPSL